MDARVKEIEARCEKRTSGMWMIDGSSIWHRGISYDSEVDPHRYTGITIDKNLLNSEVAIANLNFASQAPYLLTALRKVYEMNAIAEVK